MPIYNNMVFHATLETAILGQLAEMPAYLIPFHDAVRAWIMKARDTLVKNARTLAAEMDGKVGHVPLYTMTMKFKFAELADRLAAL